MICAAFTRVAGCVAFVMLLVATPALAGHDLVITGGRVIDPETGLDEILNIGIKGGSIHQISSEELHGAARIDAEGLVVSPGFIDLHTHSHTEEAHRLMIHDGVTSAFEIELGTADINDWYKERSKGQLINYGVGIGHIPVRIEVMNDPAKSLPVGPAAWKKASDEELEAIIDGLTKGLQEGAVAIGMGLEYTPAASDEEVLRVMQLGSEKEATVHVHLDSGPAGLDRALSLAGQSGVSLHIVHVNSSAKSLLDEYLDRIQDASTRGLDITTETYPYGAGMTRIESAKFADWKSWPDEEFGKFQWATTGEWLDRESFGVRRAQGGIIIHHARSEAMTKRAVAHPLTMIASDGYIVNGVGHPRVAGSFSRVLGIYVRDQGLLSLPDAIAKMTIKPARRLEGHVPAMKKKGRIQVGADADLNIFNPDLVADQATYENPSNRSIGIEYVVIGGNIAISSGKLVEGSHYGTAIRAPISR